MDIESLRSNLVTKGIQLGLTHTDTIKASQELDKELNKQPKEKGGMASGRAD